MANEIDLNRLRRNLQQGTPPAEGDPRIGPDGKLQEPDGRGQRIQRAVFA